jgi:hypothetical protein
MSISYSNSYFGILLDRAEDKSYTYLSTLDIDHDQLIFDWCTGNIYAYSLQFGKKFNNTNFAKISGNINANYKSRKNYCKSEGNGFLAQQFNTAFGGIDAYNLPLGDYSSTFGRYTITHRSGEVAIGHSNIHAYAFVDSLSDVDKNFPQMLFGIGNGSITTGSTRSNIFSVTDHNVVVSGDSYVGFTWAQGNTDASAYYMTSSKGNLTVAQGINAQTITASRLMDVKGSLNVDENAIIDSIQINGDSYTLRLANKYLPRQINRSFITQGSQNYYNPTNQEQYNAYVSRLENEYTIDWIDYYESTFRDSICCFKAFDTNPQSDSEYSPYKSEDYSSVIEKLDWYINGSNTSKQFILSECYPVYVSANKWRVDNYGSFQIKLQLNTTDSSHTGDILYLRPCRETYKILAAIAGDVEGWFKNHTTTINGSSFRFRWSPLTQYQDSDYNQDPQDVKTKLDFSTRSNHQIYFCIDEAKYYIKTYTGQLKEVDMGTCAPVDLSLK